MNMDYVYFNFIILMNIASITIMCIFVCASLGGHYVVFLFKT